MTYTKKLKEKESYLLGPGVIKVSGMFEHHLSYASVDKKNFTINGSISNIVVIIGNYLLEKVEKKVIA